MVDIRSLIESATFTPSNRQIRARNAFWAIPGIQVPPDANLASVSLLMPPGTVSEETLSRWWRQPGFPEWLLSPQWEQEESQRLMHTAMQRLGEILAEPVIPGSNTAPVIAAAREAREIYTKLHAGGEKKFADADIGEMTREQLDEYIRRQTSRISGK